jgi:hypothetical protein
MEMVGCSVNHDPCNLALSLINNVEVELRIPSQNLELPASSRYEISLVHISRASLVQRLSSTHPRLHDLHSRSGTSAERFLSLSNLIPTPSNFSTHAWASFCSIVVQLMSIR